MVEQEVTSAVTSKWQKGTGGPSGDECQNLVAVNPVTPPLTSNQYGDHESREGLLVAHALTAEGHDASEDGTGRGQPLVTVEPQDLDYIAFDARQSDVVTYGDKTGPLDTDQQSMAVAFSSKDSGQDAAEDVSPTLRAMDAKDSHRNGGGQVAVVMQERMESANPDNGLHGKGWNDEGVAFTMEARHRPQTVAVGEITAYAVSLRGRDVGNVPEVEEGVAPSIRQGEGGSGNPMVLEVAGTLHGGSGDRGWQNGTDAAAGGFVMPAEGMMVRRITPLEAERLQGFPDDWTLVPWKGRMMADGPRYRMLGNAWAVNVARWVGERIQLFEDLTG